MQLFTPKPYDFAASICDHGWPMLAPFSWKPESETLQRVELLDSGRVVLLQLWAQDAGDHAQLHVSVQCNVDLTVAERQELDSKLHWMLKLNEDLREFYVIAAQHNQLPHVAARGRAAAAFAHAVGRCGQDHLHHQRELEQHGQHGAAAGGAIGDAA
ncbi:MAG: hypothetical protein R2911_37835 [Caldilineaceae bacterium]